jgi:uncharacterized protein YhfF
VRAQALILDRQHRLLVSTAGGGQLPSTDVPPGARPLAALYALARRDLGLDLDAEAGTPCAAEADTYAFLPMRLPAQFSDHRLVALPEWATAPQLEDAWELYVRGLLGGWRPPARDLDVFHFGDGPELAALLAHLVVKGQKRATAGWREGMEREHATMPRPGLVSIVTDGFGFPLCAIQTERVDLVRFADVPESFARAEAEGDSSLEDWREGHRDYFGRQAARLGLAFDDDAIIVLERFRLLHVLGRAAP